MRSVVVLLAAFVTLTAGIARAAEPTAEDLIVRGLELRRAAKPGEALEMFQRAHALAPSPRTLGQMGLVETSLEHWLDAEAHVTAALATPDEMWVRKNRAFLDQALKVCRGHIGELVVTGPNGTDVAIDGRRVGTLPFVQPVRLVEGNAVVTANSAGFKDFSKTVDDRGRRQGVGGDRARPGREARVCRRRRAGTAARPGATDFSGADHRGGGALGALVEDAGGRRLGRGGRGVDGVGHHLDGGRPERRLPDWAVLPATTCTTPGRRAGS